VIAAHALDSNAAAQHSSNFATRGLSFSIGLAPNSAGPAFVTKSSKNQAVQRSRAGRQRTADE
jgi:hypothetical protein